jgi:hypothetical protein
MSVYAGAFAFYAMAWRSTKELVGRIGTWLMIVALAGQPRG